MIRSRAQELGGLPGGSPDTMHSEYLRGKMEERNHSAGAFTKRGNDVWAERSGRTFFSDGSELKGGAMDFASPVNGSGMGNLSRLTGGVKEAKGFPVSMLNAMRKEAKTGGAADALEVEEMMQRGANRARGISGKMGMGKSRTLSELKMEMEKRSRGGNAEMDRQDLEDAQMEYNAAMREWNKKKAEIDRAVARGDRTVPMLPKMPTPPPGVALDGGAKSKKSRAPNARAEIVKKVMRDRGVKMIEASKIVKREGLY